jgi:hypothetical protein
LEWVRPGAAAAAAAAAAYDHPRVVKGLAISTRVQPQRRRDSLQAATVAPATRKMIVLRGIWRRRAANGGIDGGYLTYMLDAAAGGRALNSRSPR